MKMIPIPGFFKAF